MSKNQEVLDIPDKKSNEIRFDYKTKLFFAALAFYLLVATLLGINGSSVGVWDNLFGPSSRTDIIFGSSKDIRSDEWAMHTPAILSQCNTTPSFPVKNYSLGGYKTPLVMNLPVKHFSAFLRPQYWLFFIADKERAFSFYWSMKLIILAGGIFLLLMVILENNFVLSVFGALWIFFSGYIQWWYSSPQMWPELVGFFALFTAAFIQILFSNRKIVVVAASIVFLISFFNFVVSLYPPHQVPLIYLSACIILCLCLPRFRDILNELLNNKFRLIFFVGSFVFTVCFLVFFYADAKQTLDVFANTVYPGSRRISGGGMSVVQIFNGFMGVFMAEKDFPEIWGNVCESSNFFLFFPVPIMLMCWKWFQQKKVSALDIGFAIYISIILLWMLYGFPQFIARFTLFDRVSAERTLLPLGIASIIWTCLSLHQITKHRTFLPWQIKVLMTAIILVGITFYSLYFNIVTSGFVSLFQIVIVCVFVTVASFLIINQNVRLFAGFVLIINIATFGLVNPIRIGLGPITSNPLYFKINQIVRQDPEAKWIIYRNDYLPIFTYATGAKVFNGIKYVPNLAEMNVLSSKKSDLEIYNRHASIALFPAIGSEVKFSLSNITRYVIEANLQNECWEQLNIKYGMIHSDRGIDFFEYVKKP